MSEATVSRVLNGIGPVKEETRRKVLDAAEALDYVPNAIAASFVKGISGNIGVVLPYVPKVHLFSTYYFSQILSGIGEAVREWNYNLLLLLKKQDEPFDYVMPFQTQKIDGCIVLGAQHSEEEAAALLKASQRAYPLCLVNQRFDDMSFAVVDAAHVDGSHSAVSHLLKSGFRRVAFINGPLTYSNSMDRHSGYVRALEEHGLKLDESLLFQGNYSRKSGYVLASDIGRRLHSGEIDAVFAANDRMALGLSMGLKELGLTAGKDYGLVGYDDSDAAVLCDPPLTTVQVPFFEMGKRAAEILLAFLREDKAEWGHFSEHLPTSLVIRATSNK